MFLLVSAKVDHEKALARTTFFFGLKKTTNFLRSRKQEQSLDGFFWGEPKSITISRIITLEEWWLLEDLLGRAACWAKPV